MNVLALIEKAAAQMQAAQLSFGHGTLNAFDEAAWGVLWALGLPLDSLDDHAEQTVDAPALAKAQALIDQRIATRKPMAYLTQEAYLQGVAFYVDERTIVPRSLIAELIADGGFDPWLSDQTRTALDLCTGNGSLAVLLGLAYPDLAIDAADISQDALDVARINVEKHGLQDRIRLVKSDGLAACTGSVNGRYDLIVCNPPYVNAHSMNALPAEFQAEPSLALAGGSDGMDFIRPLLAALPAKLSPHGVLVLEIGHERAHFEAAFAHLSPVWLTTSAGDEQVLLLTREML